MLWREVTVGVRAAGTGPPRGSNRIPICGYDRGCDGPADFVECESSLGAIGRLNEVEAGQVGVVRDRRWQMEAQIGRQLLPTIARSEDGLSPGIKGLFVKNG